MQGVFIRFLTNEGKEFYFRNAATCNGAMDTNLDFTFSLLENTGSFSAQDSPAA